MIAMKNKNPKTFKYDVLIDRDDVCDRTDEIHTLIHAAKTDKKIVLLAPRRYGKTSLVKNIVGVELKRARPRRLIIFVDLMDVASLDSIAVRLQHGIAKSLSESFSAAHLLKRAAGFIKNLALRVDLDPATGAPSLSIQPSSSDAQKNITALLESVRQLSEQQPIMLILDEFQDIIFVSEAEALFRTQLQGMSRASIFILGSKRHLMERMLGNANAPLFQFGDELHLSPISPEEWLPYFNERLSSRQCTITMETMRYVAERMCNVPNAMCELGAWLQERAAPGRLETTAIEVALNEMVETKQSYDYRLQGLSERERRFLTALAGVGFVTEPHSLSFLQKSNASKSGAGKMLKKFMDNGMLEYELNQGYRLSDPIFAHYLKKIG